MLHYCSLFNQFNFDILILTITISSSENVKLHVLNQISLRYGYTMYNILHVNFNAYFIKSLCVNSLTYFKR